MRPTPGPHDLADLYDAYASMLYRYAVRRTGAATAEEVVAETFLAAVAGWAGFDPDRGEVRAWLFGILTNRIARHRRNEAIHLKLLAGLPDESVAADVADRVDDRVSAAANGKALARALAELSPGDRDTLLLLAWADLTYAEIATALNIPVGTVRSRINRARRVMRGQIPNPDLTDQRSN
jgi:RNA polymerase sigma-70 factor (ECF subfamily)